MRRAARVFTERCETLPFLTTSKLYSSLQLRDAQAGQEWVKGTHDNQRDLLVGISSSRMLHWRYALSVCAIRVLRIVKLKTAGTMDFGRERGSTRSRGRGSAAKKIDKYHS